MTQGLVQVQLLGVPLVLRERSRQHGADLLREMTLLQAGPGGHDPDHPDHPHEAGGDQAGDGRAGGGQAGGNTSAAGGGGHVPGRLRQLARDLETVYGPYVAASDQKMDDALDRGLATLDVVYRLPVTAVPFLHQVQVLLAEVEQYCASDDYLLTLAPPAEVAAFRDWSIGQVLAQAAGEPPTSWAAWAALRASE